MKLYFSPKEVAMLIDERFPEFREVKRNGKKVTERHPKAGELNIRKVRRWLHAEGVLIKRNPGLCKIRGGVVLPSSAMRELWPHMWDKYCADSAMFDDEHGAPCEHDNVKTLVPNRVDWCENCGAHQFHGRGNRWVLPHPGPPAD